MVAVGQGRGGGGQLGVGQRWLGFDAGGSVVVGRSGDRGKEGEGGRVSGGHGEGQRRARVEAISARRGGTG